MENVGSKAEVSLYIIPSKKKKKKRSPKQWMNIFSLAPDAFQHSWPHFALTV